jgi:hypothetical protein
MEELNMDYAFEVEYDGVVYQVEAEYKLVDASYDDEFGTVAASYADPVAWIAYQNGAQVSITSKELQRLIWLEADKHAKAYILQVESYQDYAV